MPGGSAQFEAARQRLLTAGSPSVLDSPLQAVAHWVMRQMADPQTAMPGMQPLGMTAFIANGAPDVAAREAATQGGLRRLAALLTNMVSEGKATPADMQQTLENAGR